MNRSSALKIIARTAHTASTIIGAIAPQGSEWTLSDYQNEGDTVYVQHGDAKPAIVTIQRNGPGLIQTFATSEEASNAYDALVANPGVVWWVGLYNSSLAINGESSRRDETYLGPVHTETDKTTTTTITKKSTSVSLVPIVIGLSLGLATLIISGRSK